MAVLNRAVKDTDAIFTVQSHRGAHNVTYDTARTDLLKLVDIGLLAKSKLGRAFVFRAVSDLRVRLQVFERKK